jgi:CDP-diacylglycerol--serine O-phosphatidyltransferase
MTESTDTPSGSHEIAGGRRRSRRLRRFRKRRGVDMLPTLVTLGNLFSGFLAIAYVSDSRAAATDAERLLLYDRAVFLIFLAMIFDAVDGKVARMTGSTSKFGAELDSLCDAISFGAAPAILFKALIEHGSDGMKPKAAMILAAIYVACAVLRLARFNVGAEPDEDSHRFFQGLPSPAAAAAVVSLVSLNNVLDPNTANSWVRWVMPFAMAALGFLMVSRVRYVHAASWLFRRKSPAAFTFILFLGAVLVLFHEYCLPALCVGFVILGPLQHFLTRNRGPAEPPVAGSEAS